MIAAPHAGMTPNPQSAPSKMATDQAAELITVEGIGE